MSLTQKQIYDLNNMNVASQNVSLGTTLNSLIEGSGGGGGDGVVPADAALRERLHD